MDITAVQVVNQIKALAPANVLLLAAMLIMGLGLVPSKSDPDARKSLWGFISLISLAIAAVFAYIAKPITDLNAQSLFIFDSLANRGTWLALLAGALLVLVGWEKVNAKRASDYYAWMLLLLSGLIYSAGANDLTSLFLGLELVSLPTTVMLAVSRSDDSGRESALKYFTLAAFASGFFLLGCSYLYGTCGSTSLPAIQDAILQQRSPFCTVALTLALVGLSFRVTAVPFHFYAPDVFAGTTLPMAATLSFVPKLAGFIGIARLLGGPQLIKDFPPTLIILLLVIAAATMTIGNCAALAQRSLRRLMAYSSIAHSGYLLLGLAALLSTGGAVTPIFDYLAAYAVMTIGVFAAVSTVTSGTTNHEELTLFNGLAYRHPVAATALTISLLSLTGIPLTAGFWAKLQIFLTTVAAENSMILAMALVMAINAAIGAIYYFSILGRMFQTTAASASEATNVRTGNAYWSTSLAAAVCSVLTVVWFFFP